MVEAPLDNFNVEFDIDGERVFGELILSLSSVTLKVIGCQTDSSTQELNSWREKDLICKDGSNRFFLKNLTNSSIKKMPKIDWYTPRYGSSSR